MEKDYRIPVLTRSMSTIDCISNATDGIGFVELQSRLGIPKTTLFRILHTLEREDWIERKTDHYYLGYKMIHYGMVTLSRRNLRNVSLPFLKRLMETTGQTAHLAVLSGKTSMIIEVCETPTHIKMSSHVGSLIPLHCSSHGKILLAFAVDEPLESFLRGVSLEKRTEKTITNLQDLAHEIKKIREQGYAMDDREFFDNVRCLAAPIRGKDGDIIGALGITATTITFSEDKIPEFAAAVISIANQLSREMGNI